MAFRTYTAGALVVGTGCAGYNAADCLYDNGVTDVLLLTEGRTMGTSRNTGSDKQTYYKLSLCADARDSVYEMACDLFHGGGVHGDTALCEAAGSVRAFMKLNQLGVPFPTNGYGEYVGYKTDHDPRMRATSVGPLTSKIMTEKLEQSVLQKGIPVLDHFQVIRLLVRDNQIHGLLALDTTRLTESDHGLTVFLSPFVVLCTGGPAIVYEKKVYPPSQTGSTALALEMGAQGCNLNQWQYGLASTGFRWNVSGTYQQVLPRYVSVDARQVECEFLPDYFASPAQALDAVFLKGYQWPFDSAKIGGSSKVDLAVYHQTEVLGRRVYLDFTRDPMGLENGFSALSPETREYLSRSDALLPTPIARLARMNPQAIALYQAHGIDLNTDKLEIAVCAQHCNGGLAVDSHWRTTVRGLYAAGEIAGTFGTARPGGSALNSTQVGSQRAAEHIAYLAEKTAPDADAAQKCAGQTLAELNAMLSLGGDPMALRKRMSAEMSRCAAQIRRPKEMRRLLADLEQLPPVGASRPELLGQACKTREMLLTQRAMLSAMLHSAAQCGSTGSAMVTDGAGETLFMSNIKLNEAAGTPPKMADQVLTTVLMPDGRFESAYAPVRPLPKTDDWFETTWQAYNKTHHIGG